MTVLNTDLKDLGLMRATTRALVARIVSLRPSHLRRQSEILEQLNFSAIYFASAV